MRFELEHRFSMDKELYLAEVYFDEELGRKMDLALGLGVKERLEEEETDAIFKRVNFVRPQKDLPRAARKILGDKGLGYFETSVYYKGESRLTWAMKTEIMPDKIYGGGEIFIVADGDGVIRRVIGEITAQVFGIGKVIEKTSVENVRESYDKAAEVTRAWIRERYG